MRRYRREKIRGAAAKGKLVYLSISLSDIVILFDVVCYKPNSIFTVCSGNKIDIDDVFCTRPCFRSVLWINFPSF